MAMLDYRHSLCALGSDPRVRAFGEQLTRVRPTPKVPEWELIANRIQEYSERIVRGAESPDSAAAALDREADRILEKRRWLKRVGAECQPLPDLLTPLSSAGIGWRRRGAASMARRRSACCPATTGRDP